VKVRPKARADVTRAPSFALLALAVATAASGGQRGTPTPTPTLLSGSEISVTESGGIAGRVHAVRLSAASGRVDVEYRAREVAVSAAPFTGSLPADRYVALWRELETARVWDIRSPKPTSGADLIQTELRIRLGETSHVVRWDEAQVLTPELRRLADVARRALAAGRESAFSR
jgi:hypothetical protein